MRLAMLELGSLQRYLAAKAAGSIRAPTKYSKGMGLCLYGLCLCGDGVVPDGEDGSRKQEW